VVLQAIRLQGALPAAEIARVTQLTAQTISLITKRLLDDGLLLKGEPCAARSASPACRCR
jgi:DNA-binding MarR family transcriptional regulator